MLVYLTFLTRTGVLGDISVHSFTGEGDSVLAPILMMTLFTGLFLLCISKSEAYSCCKKKKILIKRVLDVCWCIGVFISAAYITFYTSLPVINKIFGTNKAIGEDPEYIYNRVMVLIAVVLGLLTAITQYLRYKQTPRSFWIKKIIAPTAIALLISVSISFFGGITYDKYGIGYLGAIHLAMFASIYAIIANAAYIWSGLKGKLKAAGGSVAHVGFGLVLAAILITSSKKEVISINRTGIIIPGLLDPKGKEDSGMENITLIQGVPTPMGKYMVTYQGDSTHPGDEKLYFKVNYIREDSLPQDKRTSNLYPDAFLMKGGGRTIPCKPDRVITE